MIDSSQHTSTITCTAALRVWHFCAFHFYSKREVLFSTCRHKFVDSVSYATGSCKVMLSIGYLVYSVNYLVGLLKTTRTNQVGE